MDPSEPTAPEDEAKETASVAQRAKRLIKKHRTTITAVGAVTVAVTGLALKMAQDQYLAETDETDEPLTSAPPIPEPELGGINAQDKSSRRPAVEHDVAAHPVKLNGRRLGEKGRENWAKAFEEGLVDTPTPPSGLTYRGRTRRSGSA
ncbi:hypothetical protein [Streptomyces sp. SID8499]|uniref:hypothetical protein n=1 Tax=Streptomyces sp. SID8499 TaxID=2706106 RepID=UPI0013C791F3|nr:hypothetical protein [Streptomyces sp. SID8499]NED32243.1 hypothetical protein [Streptomyces sp. SID8499]